MKPLEIIFAVICVSLVFSSILMFTNAAKIMSAGVETAATAAGVTPVDDTPATNAMATIWSLAVVMIVAALIIDVLA
jgi:hypothetical protein